MVRFKIWGNLRFLSHAETMKMFQRACVRAGIQLEYSKGYNPRPRLSLPLPRSVGVEAENELLVLRVSGSKNSAISDASSEVTDNDLPLLNKALSEQLPEGIEILSADLQERAIGKTRKHQGASRKKLSFQPAGATYQFKVDKRFLAKGLREKVKDFLSLENYFVTRRKSSGKTRGGNNKKELEYNMDVRPFVSSIHLNEQDNDLVDIEVECIVKPSGSIRIDEILGLLGLDRSSLAAPVKRKDVKWRPRTL